MANSFCFRSLSCPSAAIFPNCPFQYFPSVPCFSFDPLHPLHSQTPPWVKFAAPDLSVIWIGTALTLCLNSHARISLLRGNPNFQKGKVASLMPYPKWISQVVLCSLPLMHKTGGCTSLAIYILRGLSVSSYLWLWKQLYLNTAPKLIFQNKRLIRMGGKKGRANVKY